jgi:hypothetical protein
VTTRVYPVGLLRDWRQYRRSPPGRRRAGRAAVRRSLACPVRHACHGEWRAAKNWLNGWLAEPDPFPPRLVRCGSGWTRRRALADLDRRLQRTRP